MGIKIDPQGKTKPSESKVVRRRRIIRWFGIALQVTIYAANAIVWIISMLAFICGLVIGLDTDTIRIKDFNILDIAVTTPATSFVFHGLFLIPAATVGCFSSLKPRVVLLVIYVVLIALYFIYDGLSEFNFLFCADPIGNFYKKLNNSLHEFDAQEYKAVGLYPVSPKIYWEHLQRRAKCCGLTSFENWKKTPFSKKDGGVPDSCCSDDYDHRNCGKYVFRHPDIKGHSISDLLHKKGCIDVFPENLRPGASVHISALGNFAGALLILCGLLTVVILVLVSTKRFTPEEGLDHLDYESKDHKEGDEEQKEGGTTDAEHGKSDVEDHSHGRKRSQGRDDVRVHPLRLSKGDTKPNRHHQHHQDHRTHHHQHPDKRLKTRISFLETGPQFIPSDKSITSLENEMPDRHKTHDRNHNAHHRRHSVNNRRPSHPQDAHHHKIQNNHGKQDKHPTNHSPLELEPKDPTLKHDPHELEPIDPTLTPPTNDPQRRKKKSD